MQPFPASWIDQLQAEPRTGCRVRGPYGHACAAFCCGGSGNAAAC
jgi:hypothetical protein